MLTEASGRIRGHMPGHKGIAPFGTEDLYHLDTTEIDRTEDLYHPGPMIAAAQNAVDLYRMKGMAYIVAGEYEKALAELEKGLAAEDYGLMYFTYAVALNELGKTEELDAVKARLEEYELEYSDRMNDYFAGKLTAKQLFTEGTGDVE